MKENRRKFIPLVFCSVILIFVIVTESNAAQAREDQIRLYLKQGIEKAFNLDNQGAIIYLQKALEVEPENPTGYAYCAMVYFFFFDMSFDPKDRARNQEFMLRYIGDALAKGEKNREEF